MRELPLIV